VNVITRWIIEGRAAARLEDGGAACVVEIVDDDDADDGVFVNFQSWLERGGEHPNAHLDRKRVRVEITVLDPHD
jgi:hypothetical protein